MTEKRHGALARRLLVGLLAATTFAVPAAAQSSTTAELINSLNGDLLYVAVPITILVEAILLYTVLKFRNADEAKETKENRRLEITWTVATAVILLFVGVASYGVLANPDVTYTGGEPQPTGDAVEVEAVAFQWGWNMNYPNENISGVTAGDVDIDAVADADLSSGTPIIVVPKRQTVYISTTSEDVIHALHVPKLGLKQDSIPGQTNTLQTTPLETGVYQGYCAEYCGQAHSQMYFSVVVVEQDTYDQFVDAQTSSQSSVTAEESASLGAVAAPAA